jgi:hypothetical protein
MAKIKHIPKIILKPKSSSSSPTTGSDTRRPLGESEFARREVQWELKARRNDKLHQIPRRNHTYVKTNGEAALDDRFDFIAQRPRKIIIKRKHPKVVAAKENGTLNDRLEKYYEGFEQAPHNSKPTWEHIPLAGFCRVCSSVSEARVCQTVLPGALFF